MKFTKTFYIVVISLCLTLFIVYLVVGNSKISEVASVLHSESSSSDVYSLEDFIFYDPVKDKKCSYMSYWTPSNTNTTCYRFIVINPNDNAQSSTINAMLDHDIAVSTYNNYSTKLNESVSSWTYKGSSNIRLISQDEISTLFKLSSYSGADEIKKNGSYFDGTTVVSVLPYQARLKYLMSNSLYYSNGSRVTNYGYWTSTKYSSSTPDSKEYAYTITEYGSNRLVITTGTRGIRPVVSFAKSKIEKHNYKTTITPSLEHQYTFLTQTFSNPDTGTAYTYKQMQGFHMVNGNVVFYSSHSSNPDYGILFGYNGNASLNGSPYYYKGGHGNSISYDSKRNQILVTNGTKLNVFDPSNLSNLISEINVPGTNGRIAYDSYHDYYVRGYEAANFALINTTLNSSNEATEILYTIDDLDYGVSQGLDYYKGYIYAPVFYSSCPNIYQTWCLSPSFSADIYVYNAKLNQDGTPSVDFGKLVKVYNIANTEIGELEDISFYNNKLYFGFAAQQKDSVNVYKIYSVPYSTVKQALGTNNVEYRKDGDNVVVSITNSKDDIHADGWTNVSSKKIEKTFNTFVITSATVCDYYGNCGNVSIDFESNVNRSEEEENAIIDDEDDDAEDENPKTGAQISIISFAILIVLLISLKLFVDKMNKIYRV